ncbi:uncharacterized protein LOC143887685 [Tasmannia lanceolata]|uniref:uncharacterized protein LOC143887685 n=1 Tax=Tasmannia lanceolata TaxID=3420 RepID=UPI004063EA70
MDVQFEEEPLTDQSEEEHPNRSSASSSKRKRGPTRCKKTWGRQGPPEPVEFNQIGQPDSENTNPFKSFLGNIARTDNKPYVIADLGKKWREWKSTLRTKYFLQNEPPPPGSVIPSEYQILCDFWNSPEGQKLCATNKANRAQQTIAHTAGSRSYARVTKMEFKAKKKMPSRADTFVITHTKKDGEAVDPKSKEIMEKIKERQEQNPEPESSGIPSRDDHFGQLMGEETRGRVRMLGFFATPSTTLGTPTRPPQPRGNSLHLNTKMAQLEQVNAIMAEELTQVKQQMSQILTHLQGVSPNYTPEDVLQSRANAASSSGSHGLRSPSSDEVVLLSKIRKGVQVARGIFLSRDPNDEVDDLPIGLGYSMVQIDVVFEPEEPLLKPSLYLKTIGDAAGAPVAWQSYLIRPAHTT